MAHRLRAFQPAEHFLDAVQVMVRPINPVPLCLVIGGLFIFPPDGDRVIAHILIEFFLLPAARDQLRREIEIMGQLLLCQHVQLFALRAAPVAIAPRHELDEPDDARLVLRFQILIFGAGELVRADIRALRENRLGHIVID